MPIFDMSRKDPVDDLTPDSTDAEIRANPKIREDYGDLLDLYPDHPVVIDPRGSRRVLRWKANAVVNHMTTNLVDLNDLWRTFLEQKMPLEDMAAVYRMMGYSLCGFEEVFSSLLWPEKDMEDD